MPKNHKRWYSILEELKKIPISCWDFQWLKITIIIVSFKGTNARKILFNLILRCIKSVVSLSINKIIDKSTINHHFKAFNYIIYKNTIEMIKLSNC